MLLLLLLFIAAAAALENGKGFLPGLGVCLRWTLQGGIELWCPILSVLTERARVRTAPRKPGLPESIPIKPSLAFEKSCTPAAGPWISYYRSRRME